MCSITFSIIVLHHAISLFVYTWLLIFSQLVPTFTKLFILQNKVTYLQFQTNSSEILFRKINIINLHRKWNVMLNHYSSQQIYWKWKYQRLINIVLANASWSVVYSEIPLHQTISVSWMFFPLCGPLVCWIQWTTPNHIWCPECFPFLFGG